MLGTRVMVDLNARANFGLWTRIVNTFKAYTVRAYLRKKHKLSVFSHDWLSNGELHIHFCGDESVVLDLIHAYTQSPDSYSDSSQEDLRHFRSTMYDTGLLHQMYEREMWDGSVQRFKAIALDYSTNGLLEYVKSQIDGFTSVALMPDVYQQDDVSVHTLVFM